MRFSGSGLNGTGRSFRVVTASDSVIKATSSAAFGFVSVCVCVRARDVCVCVCVCELKSWC